MTNYGSFIAHHDNRNYKLLQDYYKLRQNFLTKYSNVVTNYDSGLLQIATALLQITAKIYITNHNKKLLQIAAAVISEKFKIITNYVKFYFMLRQFLVLLQITTNFSTNYGRSHKSRRSDKLRHNSKI